MNELVVSETIASQLQELSLPINLITLSGKRLGCFVPAVDPSLFEVVRSEPSAQELAQTENSDEWYSTNEVLHRLENCEQERFVSLKGEPYSSTAGCEMSLDEPLTSSDKMMMNAIAAARKSWSEWQDVLKHRGSIASNPLLTNTARFGGFLRGFAVARTIRSGTYDQLRLQLIKELPEVLRDDTGRALDELHSRLCPDYGTCEGRRGLVSALSKISAFVRPERFVARDSYSMKGLNSIRGVARTTPFRSYAEYLQEFDTAWHSQLQQKAMTCLTRLGPKSSDESQASFLRRVVDIYLMQCGDTKRNLVLIKGQN